MSDNPQTPNLFADINPSMPDLPSPATEAKENLFSDFPQVSSTRVTGAGSFLAHAARGAAPTAAGIAAAAPMAEAGAALGALTGPAAPILAPVGAFVGGLAGFFGGSYAAEGAQDYAVRQMPDNWQDALGQSTRMARLQEEQHPVYSFMGAMAPYLLTMTPGALTTKALDLPENATAFQRIMANPITARIFSGAAMGGMELGQEAASGETPDWAKIAISTGLGVVFNKPNRFGEYLHSAGMAPIRAFRAPIDMPREGILDPNEPTVAQGADLNVLGTGTTEATFMGGQQRSEMAATTAHNMAADETAAVGALPTPDYDAIARRMEPELFATNDELLARRDGLRTFIDNASNPPDSMFAALDGRQYAAEEALRNTYLNSSDVRNYRAELAAVQAERQELTTRREAWGTEGYVEPIEVSLARQHLADTNRDLLDLGPQISAARRRAEEAGGLPVEEPASAAVPEIVPAPVPTATTEEPPPPARSASAQRDFIVADQTQRLLAAGMPQDQAAASAQVVASYYDTMARRFDGRIGTAENLYRSWMTASVRGPQGRGALPPPLLEPKPRPPAPEPAAPAPAEETAPAAPPVSEPVRLAAEAQEPGAKPRFHTDEELRSKFKIPRTKAGNELIVSIQSAEIDLHNAWMAAQRTAAPVAERVPRNNRATERLAESIGVPVDMSPREVAAEAADRLPPVRVAEEATAHAEAGDIEYAEAEKAAEAITPEVKTEPAAFYGSDQARPLEELEREHGPPIKTAEAEQRPISVSEPESAQPGSGPVPEGGGPSGVVGETGGRVEEEAGRANAPVISPSGMSVVETRHTKTGEPLFVATGGQRVDATEFAGMKVDAKIHGGYWSSFRGRGGVPGFAFKTREAAEGFIRAREAPALTAAQVTEQAGRTAPPLPASYWMSEAEIDGAVERFVADPILGPATRWLAAYRDAVNVRSDSLAYWRAGRLMALIHAAGSPRDPVMPTAEDIKRAMTPIKAFATRQKFKLPESDLTRETPEERAIANAVAPAEGKGPLPVTSAPPEEVKPAARKAEPRAQETAKPPPPSVSRPENAQRPADWGANNKLVTSEEADQIRARLRAKFNQFRTGIDPEMMLDGARLAVYHVEAGARAFADFTREMVADVGEVVRPYLRSWYEAARHWPGIDNRSMTSPADIDTLPPAEAPQPTNEPLDRLEAERLYHAHEETPLLWEIGQKIADGFTPAEIADTRIGDRLSEAEIAALADQLTELGELPEPTEREEGENGIQGALPLGDEGAGPEGVHGVAPIGQAGTAPAGENAGGLPHEGGPAGEQAEERVGKLRPGGRERGGGVGKAPTDRVPDTGERPEPRAAGRFADRPDARVEGTNFSIEPGDLAEGRGTKAKARDNIAAIELAKRLIAEDRPATRAEQAILVKYTGWGGLKGAFEDNQGNFSKGFEDIGARLKSALSDEEYRTAAQSTQYAHYTAEHVVRSMWDAMRRMGYDSGLVFEPGMGVGHFLGLMPPDMAAKTEYQGIERDVLTSQIAKLLYPQSGVRQADYIRTPMPEGAFDLVIGNPPFSQTKVLADPKYAARGFNLHDYFFAKSLDSVRPGGLLAFITSAHTMNNLGSESREYMAARAELVGAIRLPNTAFRRNANTEVTTDILFFQKRPEGIVEGAKPSWTETVVRTLPDRVNGGEREANVSRYFEDHPENILGDPVWGEMQAGGDYAVEQRADSNLEADLQAAVLRLPEDIMTAQPTPEERAVLDFSSGQKKDGSYYLGEDGRLMQYRDGAGKEVGKRGTGARVTADERERIEHLIPMRDALRDVFAADLAEDETKGAEARTRLNEHYDRFIEKFGPINKAEFRYQRPTIAQQESARLEAREEARFSGEYFDDGDFDPSDMLRAKSTITEISKARQAAREAAMAGGRKFNEGTFDPADMPDNVYERRPNIKPFMADPESYRLRSIENYNEETGESSKKDIFFTSILKRERESEINSANDGVLWSMNKLGRFDLDAIASKMGKDRSDIIGELGDSIYKVPGTRDTYQTKDEYLSGDVVSKLQTARAEAESDPDIRRNIPALEAALPPPLAPTDISMILGMPWIPIDTVREFVRDHLQLGEPGISHSDITGTWHVDGDNWHGTAGFPQWGINERNAFEILSDTMNRTPPRIYVWEGHGSDRRRVFDSVATQSAQDKVEAMKGAFSEWIAADTARGDGLAAIYNDKLNRTVLRQYDGSYMTTPGVASTWSWRPHQTRVVARIVQSGSTYMAHSVGAGKAQPLDAKVLTPTGWVPMGKICVGDLVIAGDGSPTRVTGVFPQGDKEIFRIGFSDGASTECCDEHLWLTQTYLERSQGQRAAMAGRIWKCGAPHVRSLAEIRTTLSAPHLGAKNHSIPMVGAVQFAASSTPLDPYLLGALLGDGCFREDGVMISSADADVLEMICGVIPDDCRLIHQSVYDWRIAYVGAVKCTSVGFQGINRQAAHPVLEELRRVGLNGRKAHEKFVPHDYLFNSVEVRLALLQGLMDTDGWTQRHSTCFGTTSRRLADDVAFIVRSLGGVVSETEKTPSYAYRGVQKIGRVSYTLHLKLPPHVLPFRLPRKAVTAVAKTKYLPTRYVTSVESIGKKTAQCIAVAHPSHLYVTDDFIVTHNTSAMIGAGMEMRRLGLVRKPLYVVPNHMLGQFTKEFYEQYPTARISVADEEHFHTDRRRQFVANVAQDDLDAVIMTHSSFVKIPISDAFQAHLIQEQIEMLDEAISELSGPENRISRGRVEKQKEAFEQKLSKQGQTAQDQVLNFEEFGTDFLFVDEAHQFRKLSFGTKQGNLKGITPKGSNMAWNLYTKVRYLDSQKPGRSVVFASGTPITNTMGELYSLSRFMQPEALKDRGLSHFDSWAQTFGDTKTGLEETAAGTYHPVTRFGKFVNLPELYKMVGEVMDVVTPQQLEQYVTRPKLVTGTRQFHLAPRTEILDRYQSELGERMEAIKNRKGPPQKGDDILLSVINDGRHSAIDPRFVEDTQNDPRSKLNMMIQNVADIYHRTGDVQFYDPRSNYEKESFRGPATQMIFANLGVNGRGPMGFSSYQWIKEALRRAGVPADQVAFIGDYPGTVQRQALFNDMNEGKVRVLVGSTQKMGTGVNAQRRLFALHNLDPLWFPADDEQRVGRILRQGNHNPEIEVHDYSTKGTYDSAMWKMMGNKARFIEQFFRGDPELRNMDDIGEASMYEQASAMATTDERIITLTQMKQDLDRAVRRKSAFHRDQYALRRQLQSKLGSADYYRRLAESYRENIDRREDTTGDKFSMMVGGEKLTKRKEAADSLATLTAERADSLGKDSDTVVGRIGGFSLVMSRDDRGNLGFSLRIASGDRSIGFNWNGSKSTHEAYIAAAEKEGEEAKAKAAESTMGASGLIPAAEYALRSFEEGQRYAEQQAAKNTQEAEHIRPLTDQPFTGEDEITRLTNSVNDLEGQLKKEAQEKANPPPPGSDLYQRVRRIVQGRITMSPGEVRSLITLSQHADASTFMHETAHDWLKHLLMFASHEAAPEDLKADAAIVRRWLNRPADWMGFLRDGTPDAEAHEKFATGFEQYLREGHAPSTALARVFAQFKEWLTRIYQTIKGLGEPISDDIRGVFDRMLSTEPQRTTHGPVREPGPTLATVHETDAKETEPSQADAVADRLGTERRSAQPSAEIDHEIAATQSGRGAVGSETPGAAAGPGGGTAEPGGEAGGGAGGRGALAEGGGQSEPVSEGGGVGAGPGQVGGGRGQAPVERGGIPPRAGAESGGRGEQRRPVSGSASGPEQIAPGPAETVGTEEPKLVDLAGNIRVENLTDVDTIVQAIHESAQRNGDFKGVRGGMTKGQMLDLANAMSLDPREINETVLEKLFGQTQDLGVKILAARGLIVRSADIVANAMKAAADSNSDKDLGLLAVAIGRHDMIQSVLAGVTAEWGRAGNAFHSLLSGWEKAQNLNQFLRDNTGRDLFQLKVIAKLGRNLDTPGKVSKYLRDAQKRSFGRMLLEYWINGLISGISTHVTYVVGNSILAAEKAGPETAAAWAIGKLRQTTGRTGERVRLGEVGAQFGAAFRELPAAVQATLEAYRSGATTMLPGETTRVRMPFQGDTELVTSRGMTNKPVTWAEVKGDAYSLVQGMRDGVVAAGSLVSGGGVAGAPTFGWEFTPGQQIPNLQVRGITALPIGSFARFPSRNVAAIHSFQRSVNYSMEINALAFRQATEEGLSGTALASRIADLRQNPTDEIMQQARAKATDLTLMGPAGKWVDKLSQWVNHPVNLPLLGETPVMKFIDPFIHIAANIMDQALMQRTPIGLFSPEIRADLAGRNGNVAADTAVAKMIVGSMLGITFGGLAAQGLASGSGPSNPNKAAMWRLTGNQAHSVRVGDMWYAMNRLGPMGMLASVSADLYDVSHQIGREDADVVAKTLMHAFTQNILDESFMRGPSDLIKAMTDPDHYGAGYVRTQLASFLPYSVLMAQMARATDPYSRQARTIMDTIRQHIPGISEELFPRRDIWGAMMPSGGALLAPGITAIYAQKMSNDPVNMAMMRIGVFPGPVGRTIRNVKLTDQEYDDFARLAGNGAKMRLDQIVRSDQFQLWDPVTQHNVFDEIIKQSREAARGLVMMKYPHIAQEAAKAQTDRIRKAMEPIE